uniref:Uncharacterized protein n=1 Tax=Oryza brachyantha TaxID=4533 RepID=J3LV24_ORYBR
MKPLSIYPIVHQLRSSLLTSTSPNPTAYLGLYTNLRLRLLALPLTLAPLLCCPHLHSAATSPSHRFRLSVTNVAAPPPVHVQRRHPSTMPPAHVHHDASASLRPTPRTRPPPSSPLRWQGLLHRQPRRGRACAIVLSRFLRFECINHVFVYDALLPVSRLALCLSVLMPIPPFLSLLDLFDCGWSFCWFA